MDAVEIPAKKQFKIGEVARLFDLEPYVLRYWETEFDQLKPRKTASGQRSYNRDDVELVATIQHLLYTEMYTIAGARRQLERAELLEFELGPDADAGLDALRDELDDVVKERDAAHRHIDELEGDLANLRAEMKALEEELARMEKERDERQHQELPQPGPDVIGRQRRVLLNVRRELQAVASAARAVA